MTFGSLKGYPIHQQSQECRVQACPTRSSFPSNAPFGELAAKTPTVSTYAIESDTAGDATYKNLENQIASWTAQRDDLTAQIQSMLEGAEFQGKAIDEQEASQLTSKGKALLEQRVIAHPTTGNARSRLETSRVATLPGTLRRAGTGPHGHEHFI